MGRKVAIVGLGAYGSACSYHFAKLGAEVVGIDQFSPPHNFGSSHGGTRITRSFAFESDQYIRTAQRTVEIFSELQEQYKRKLFLQNGLLVLGAQEETKGIVSHGKEDPLSVILQHRTDTMNVFSASEVRAKFPSFLVPSNTIGCYDKSAGTLYPETCVQVQMQAARELGAKFLLNNKVHDISETSYGVRITTNNGVVDADSCIIAAGPWVSNFLNETLAENFYIQRQVQYWFNHSNPAEFSANNYPNFVWFHKGEGGDDCFYGFPAQDDASQIKISREVDMGTVNPDDPNIPVSEEEISSMFLQHAKGRISGLSETCSKVETCFYTVTPNSMFLMAEHPSIKDTFVISACSGHGFKHSTALAEIMAYHVLEKKYPYGKGGLEPYGWGAIKPD